MFAASKKRVTVVVAILGAIALSTAAYAYWTAGGSGTGEANTSTTVALEVNQDSLVAMYPGSGSETITGTFNNDNPGPIYVDKLTVSIDSVTKDSAAVGACGVSDYTLAGNTTFDVKAEVPPGDFKGSWGGPSGATIAFNNKPTVNQDGCKNATVNLSYVIG